MAQKNNLLYIGLFGLGAYLFLKPKKEEGEIPEGLSPDGEKQPEIPAVDETEFPMPGTSQAETIDKVIDAKKSGMSDEEAEEFGKQVAEKIKNAKVIVKKSTGKHIVIRSGKKRIKTKSKKHPVKYVLPKRKHKKRKKRTRLKLSSVNTYSYGRTFLK